MLLENYKYWDTKCWLILIQFFCLLTALILTLYLANDTFLKFVFLENLLAICQMLISYLDILVFSATQYNILAMLQKVRTSILIAVTRLLYQWSQVFSAQSTETGKHQFYFPSVRLQTPTGFVLQNLPLEKNCVHEIKSMFLEDYTLLFNGYKLCLCCKEITLLFSHKQTSNSFPKYVLTSQVCF